MTADESVLLLTPGPLTTSPSVREAMLRDWGTWDDDYNLGVVTPIREGLVNLATGSRPEDYTTILMQGSGTFSLESMIGSALPPTGKLLVLANGCYGHRLAQIAQRLKIDHMIQDPGGLKHPDLRLLETTLAKDPAITHVAVVHHETSAGMMNPLADIARIVKAADRLILVDSMSAFGGVPLDVAALDIDFLVSSANKCLQGVPGFGFIMAKISELKKTQNYARSLSLDMYDQWAGMEEKKGKWRFTSPTHVVHAFYQAMKELKQEGGVQARFDRYSESHRRLVQGMESMGFCCVLPADLRSPFITSFHSPVSKEYKFTRFYELLKQKGFIIYVGTIEGIDCFRVGTIGHVFPEDIDRFLAAVKESIYWT